MTTTQAAPPKVFISYSHDSADHDEWVLGFAARLQEQAGVAVIIDRVDYDRRLPWNAFMLQSVNSSDFTLIICTRAYKAKADSLTGNTGVGIETLISLQTFYAAPQKFIPVLRERLEDGAAAIPMYLHNYNYFDFTLSSKEGSAFEALVFALWNAKPIELPPIGSKPNLSSQLYRYQLISDEDIASRIGSNVSRLNADFCIMFNLPDGSAKGPFRFVEPRITRVIDADGSLSDSIQTSKDGFINFLNDPTQKVWVLLGDYGCGKTSFCYWLLNRSLDLNLPGRHIYLVLLPCRQHPSMPHNNLDSWFDQLLYTGPRAANGDNISWNFNMASLRVFMKSHEVILIIDGLDETNVDSARQPYDNYLDIINLLKTLPCKSILTSRISFVSSLASAVKSTGRSLPFSSIRPIDFRRMISGVVVDCFLGFDLDNLREYFSQSTLTDGEARLADILDNGRLAELSHKPVFANLLAQASSESISSDKGILGVYEEIAVNWVSTSRQLLNVSQDELLVFLQELAFYMFVSNAKEIPEKQFRQYARLHFGKMDEQLFSKAHFEITNETFLIRTATGNLTFSHNTFAEFLVARKLNVELTRFKNANLYIRLLSEAINYFLVCLLDADVVNRAGSTFENYRGMAKVFADEKFDETFGSAVSTFYIDRRPVSNAEYKAFLDLNPDMVVPCSENHDLLTELCDRENVDWVVNDVDGYLKACERFCWNPLKRAFPDGEDDYPVVYVSYFDAWVYARWQGKRLPTLMEWIKAAVWDSTRGIVSEYGLGGVVPNPENCNFGGTRLGPTAIGSLTKEVSPTGCQEMTGNVSEWTTDWVDEQKLFMVIAGGAWHMRIDQISAFNPSHSLPNVRRNFVGFRLVRG